MEGWHRDMGEKTKEKGTVVATTPSSTPTDAWGWRQTDTDKQTDKQTEREREKQTDRERERERSEDIPLPLLPPLLQRPTPTQLAEHPRAGHRAATRPL